MNDIVAGLGVAIVFEGLLWAVAPDFARRMVQELASVPPRQISAVAWSTALFGLFLVWLARG